MTTLILMDCVGLIFNYVQSLLIFKYIGRQWIGNLFPLSNHKSDDEWYCRPGDLNTEGKWLVSLVAARQVMRHRNV